MADVWLPGAHRDPGRNAGYNAGRSSMVRAVAHYTVGSDSRNVGRDGYFHWLIHRDASRENGCTQYAEIDAITWHAANAGNPYGPGIEWERMTTGGMNAEGLSNAQPLTDNQRAWGTRIIDFCAAWGITAALYDGPRFGAGGWRGWVNHQAIDSSRSDGLLRAEWNAMTSGAPAPDEPVEDDMTVWVCTEAGKWSGAWVQEGPYLLMHFPSVNSVTAGRIVRVPASQMEMIFNDVGAARDALGIGGTRSQAH